MTSISDTRTFTCPVCSEQFTGQILTFDGRELLANRACEPCVQARQDERRSITETAQRSHLDAEWQIVCPPLYRETQRSRLNADVLAFVDQWDGSRSIGLIGKPGTTKTRCAFLALRSQHRKGLSCAYTTGSGLATALANSASNFTEERSEGKAHIASVKTADVALIDDLGKQRFTDAGEQLIYDILETRNAFKRPTIWTSNSNARQLKARLSDDRADAILRRLAEFSDIHQAK